MHLTPSYHLTIPLPHLPTHPRSIASTQIDLAWTTPSHLDINHYHSLRVLPHNPTTPLRLTPESKRNGSGKKLALNSGPKSKNGKPFHWKTPKANQAKNKQKPNSCRLGISPRPPTINWPPDRARAPSPRRFNST